MTNRRKGKKPQRRKKKPVLNASVVLSGNAIQEDLERRERAQTESSLSLIFPHKATWIEINNGDQQSPTWRVSISSLTLLYSRSFNRPGRREKKVRKSLSWSYTVLSSNQFCFSDHDESPNAMDAGRWRLFFAHDGKKLISLSFNVFLPNSAAKQTNFLFENCCESWRGILKISSWFLFRFFIKKKSSNLEKTANWKKWKKKMHHIFHVFSSHNGKCHYWN